MLLELVFHQVRGQKKILARKTDRRRLLLNSKLWSLWTDTFHNMVHIKGT